MFGKTELIMFWLSSLGIIIIQANHGRYRLIQAFVRMTETSIPGDFWLSSMETSIQNSNPQYYDTL